MKKEQILNQLTRIFRDIFNDADLEIQHETSASDIDDWDSLAQVNLVVAIEKLFNVRLDLDEIMILKNVGDMVSLLERKVNI